jgi:hypothetical protein
MPVTTRRQAKQLLQQHAASHLNLNNLPAEIIEEIAFHLKCEAEDSDETATDPLEFEDVEYERMSVKSMDPEDGVPEVKVMPCCRSGDSEEEVDADGTRIPILNGCSTFSATSKRIREIVFHRRQTRRRTIRYCPRWLQETQHLPLVIRSRYT